MTTLEERIFRAFADGATSSGVADLIAEAEAAVVASGEEAEAARTSALNPTLAAADVAAARREMEDASFRRDRMQEAVRRLGERLREVKAQEEQARRQVLYDAALVERDKLAGELAEVYPPLAEKLADLAARIAENDAAIERVDRKLPDGATWIAGAEAVARGVPANFVSGVSNVPRLTRDLRLPAFNFTTSGAAYLWPAAER
jgi:chromosome segregation ATPase